MGAWGEVLDGEWHRMLALMAAAAWSEVWVGERGEGVDVWYGLLLLSPMEMRVGREGGEVAFGWFVSGILCRSGVIFDVLILVVLPLGREGLLLLSQVKDVGNRHGLVQLEMR